MMRRGWACGSRLLSPWSPEGLHRFYRLRYSKEGYRATRRAGYLRRSEPRL